MSRTVNAADVLVYKPGNESDVVEDADYAIRDDILNIDLTERGQDLIDEASISLDGNWADRVTPGDRLVFRIGKGTIRPYGEGTYGSGPYGFTMDDRWTGMTRPVTYIERGRGLYETGISGEDFVFGILNQRHTFSAFTERQISGTDDSILNQIIGDDAPEIDLSEVAVIEDEVSVSWAGKSLLDCVRQLAIVGDAIVGQDGRKLLFKRIEDIESLWALDESDYVAPLEIANNDDGLVNRLRVEGGTGRNEDDSQEVQTGYERVTDTNRLIYQLDTTKSTIPKVEVWTRRGSTDEALVVRLQEDDGAGTPRDVENRDADVARRTINEGFLSVDGYTSFEMRPQDHSFYSPDPHLIIEADGENGQDVGINDSDEPTFIQYYAYPIGGVFSRKASQLEYRRRDDTLKDATLQSRDQISIRGNAEIEHRDEPEREVSFEAESNRAHELGVLDVFTVDRGEVLDDDVIVLERDQSFSGGTNRLTTTITARDVSSI